MTVALVIFALFAGLSMVLATVACALLIANGKLTLPNTNMRRVQRERTQLTLAEIRLARESMNMRVDDAIQLRLERALDPSPRAVLATDLVKKEEWTPDGR